MYSEPASDISSAWWPEQAATMTDRASTLTTRPSLRDPQRGAPRYGPSGPTTTDVDASAWRAGVLASDVDASAWRVGMPASDVGASAWRAGMLASDVGFASEPRRPATLRGRVATFEAAFVVARPCT